LIDQSNNNIIMFGYQYIFSRGKEGAALLK